MRRVLAHIVVAIFRVLKLDDESVGQIALRLLATRVQQRGNLESQYCKVFRTVVPAAREGLDVGLLGSWVDAFVAEC
jgi:hypothetical protein